MMNVGRERSERPKSPFVISPDGSGILFRYMSGAECTGKDTADSGKKLLINHGFTGLSVMA